MSIRKTRHARYELWYHVAWCTKYRKHVFQKEENRLAVERLFRKIAERYGMEIEKVEVLSDHIHLLLSVPPRIAPSTAVQILKSASTRAPLRHFRWLRSLYWGGEIWVGGYFIRSAGPGLTKESIEKYIEDQSEED